MRDFLTKGSPIIMSGEITSDSEDTLKAIVDIVINKDFEGKYRPLTHFKIKNNVLKFWDCDYKVEEQGGSVLPFPLTRDNAFDFIYNCMKSVNQDDIPYEYEGGDGGHGFGFTAKVGGNFGDPILKINVKNVYYSK